MKLKKKRQDFILKEIKQNRITNQEQLLHILRSEGFDVTQATLSRDFKTLQVGKLSDGVEQYYAVGNLSQEIEVKEVMMHSIISVEFSLNLCIIRTAPGYASSVAVIFDEVDLTYVIGSIAGDDTLMLIIDENYERDAFQKELVRYWPEFENKFI